MRIKSIFTAVFLCVITSSLSLAGTPKIDFSERVWDFGLTPQKSTVTHVFWIKNTGTDTLRDISVKTP